MKESIKNTFKGILFTLILLALLWSVSWIFIPRNNTQDDWKYDYTANGFLAEPDNSLDVLFLGDSEVFSSINPVRIWDSYGITSYCCSTGKQRLWYTLEYLYDFYKNQSPRVVVLETDLILKYFSIDDLILHAPEHYLPVLRYHDRWKKFSFDEVFRTPQYTYIDDYKGYHFYSDIDAADEEGYMEKTDERAYISKMNRLYLNAILSCCNRNGSKLILLSTPSTKNWNMKKHNRTQQLSEELGIDYIDMNMPEYSVDIDWSKDTKDKGDHLNYYGAVKVTDAIGEYLNSLGILSDHRNEKGYAHWKDSLDKLKSDVKNKLKTEYVSAETKKNPKG